MTTTSHLSEEERQGVADGTLDVARQRVALEHIAMCASCGTDVARLKTLMSQIQHPSPPMDAGDDLWPSIRTRIEHSSGAPTAPKRRRPWIAIASTALAAALLLAAFVEMRDVRTRSTPIVPPVDASFASVSDSSQAYAAEAKVLLDELEMQRAMLRPNTSAALDSDLAVIDRSIDELKTAIARDPKNLALQQLLAASYREKVELLRRASNAG